MREININPFSIILEPFGRNTAPAIAVGALEAINKGKDPNLLVLASDHYIKDETKFLNAIKCALKESIKGRLVTFGVVPTSAETGYGYIKSERQLDPNKYYPIRVDNFIEKIKKLGYYDCYKDEYNSDDIYQKRELFYRRLKNGYESKKENT